MDNQSLVRAALEARKRAYAPYSKFPVGAALLCEDGTVVTGANVENASYGLCICAERVAVFKAVSEGKRGFIRLAVACGEDYCRPCGACRQVLFEHAPSLEILMVGPRGDFRRTTIQDLLPDAFSF